MTIALSDLKIIDAVVHDVPQPGAAEPLILTDRPIGLDAELEEYFRDKLSESLAERGIPIQADPDQPPVVRDGVLGILSDPATHVSKSQDMAKHLFDLQKKTNSPGLLTVIRATSNDSDVIAVLKLEREVGVHILIEQVGDQRVIDLEFLRDLTLTRKTRVFKAAIFELANPAEAISMRGLASDDQRSRQEGRGLARFFLSDFLGCQLSKSPEKTTQDFWTATQVFINEDVASPDRKGRYQVAVQAFLEEPEEDIRPEAFLTRSINDADRPRLRQRLRDQGLEPAESIPKDTGLIERKIAGFRLTFDHGMLLIGGRTDLQERVDLPATNGVANTVIKDSISALKGR